MGPGNIPFTCVAMEALASLDGKAKNPDTGRSTVSVKSKGLYEALGVKSCARR